MHELLTRFPAGVIAADAELAAPVAGDQLARGSLEEAERCLALATRTLESVPADRRDRAQVVLAVVRMRLARQRGDLTTVAGEARRLLASAVTADPAPYDTARAAPGGDLRALALIDLGIAEAWTARFDEANRHLDDGIALARQIGRPYLEVTGLAHLAQLESWQSFRLGADRGLQAIELATEHGWAEARVLRYLPTKLSTPEIAGELYLSVNTVKTHMRHLYDKLGVHRRHEAVEQARALGLLAPSPRRS